jgi:hypothetical protein
MFRHVSELMLSAPDYYHRGFPSLFVDWMPATDFYG